MKESDDSKTVKPCIQCDYVTSSAIGLKRHVESKHEGIQYFCEQCNYVSSEKGNLKKHILNKHEGIRYYCDLCDYSATRSNILKKHVDSKHPGYLSTKSKAPHEVILYPCDQSDSFATGSDNLDLRIASQNEGKDIIIITENTIFLRYRLRTSNLKAGPLKKTFFARHTMVFNGIMGW